MPRSVLYAFLQELSVPAITPEPVESLSQLRIVRAKQFLSAFLRRALPVLIIGIVISLVGQTIFFVIACLGGKIASAVLGAWAGTVIQYLWRLGVLVVLLEELSWLFALRGEQGVGFMALVTILTAAWLGFLWTATGWVISAFWFNLERATSFAWFPIHIAAEGSL